MTKIIGSDENTDEKKYSGADSSISSDYKKSKKKENGFLKI